MRIDFGNAPTTLGPVRTITGSSLYLLGNVDLAYDWDTGSHWALTYTRSRPFVGTTANIARLGQTAAPTESTILSATSQSPKSPSVAFARPSGQQKFLTAVGVTQIASHHLAGYEFIYPGAITIAMINNSPLGATFNLPLPDAPLLIADLSAQAGILPVGGTPFVTLGLAVQIR